MNYLLVNIQIKVYWQFKEYPHLKVSKDKQIINSRTGKLLKYHPRGYFIENRYYKRSELNAIIEKIPKTDCPF